MLEGGCVWGGAPFSVCFPPLLSLGVVEETFPNVESFQRPEVPRLYINLWKFITYNVYTFGDLALTSKVMLIL